MLACSHCAIVCLIAVGLEAIFAQSVEHYFHKHGLVPEVMKTAPKNLLYVKFPSGSEAYFGNELTPAATVQTPTVLWNTPTVLATLIMFDADAYPDRIHLGNESVVFWSPSKEDAEPWSKERPYAPSRKSPSRRIWLHWLVGNIPGRKVARGDVIAAYNGPTPPKGTGAHRYVLLVFQHKEKISLIELAETEKGRRGNFNLAKFASLHHLGEPVAGNFFLASPHVH